MMNQLRGIAVKDNPELMEKYKSSLHYVIQPIIQDVENAIDQGVIGNVNPEIMGYAFMGLAEYTAELHYLYGKYSKSDVLKQLTLIIDSLVARN